MNYNRDCPGAIAPVGLVRSVRTNELQQLYWRQECHLGWCTPCAPMNYNDALHETGKHGRDALRAHQ